MQIDVRAHLHYASAVACDLLLQIEPSNDAAQHVLFERLSLPGGSVSREISGDHGIGRRRWITAQASFACEYVASFDVQRRCQDLASLPACPVAQTPAEATPYLMPSRYCHPEAFFDLLADTFSGLSGGPLVVAANTWIKAHFTYDIFASPTGTTATDTLHSRAGVCRDYAHVLISILRAAGIPARYVSAYAPGVDPQDFHAVCEVYLDNAWHLIDPTGMADPHEIIRIGVGRDAADVSFLTSYGQLELKNQAVDVIRVDPS